MLSNASNQAILDWVKDLTADEMDFYANPETLMEEEGVSGEIISRLTNIRATDSSISPTVVQDFVHNERLRRIAEATSMVETAEHNNADIPKLDKLADEHKLVPHDCVPILWAHLSDAQQTDKIERVKRRAEQLQAQ